MLVGPSGSGKTTALRMLAGLEAVTEGEVRIGGRVVNRLAPLERDIAMVFQNYALYPQMTVAENIAFALRLRKAPKAEIDARVVARRRRSSSGSCWSASRASCRAASSSAWRSAARSSATRRCS